MNIKEIPNMLNKKRRKRFTIEDDIFTLDILKGLITAGFIGFFISDNLSLSGCFFLALSLFAGIICHYEIQKRKTLSK